MINLVVAADKKRGIGKEGKLPWRLKGDMKYFRELTTGHIVIMGRKTWESIPEKFRPLPDRFNIVLSRKKGESLSDSLFKGVPAHLKASVAAANSLDQALEIVRTPQLMAREIFVIGGGAVYRDAIARPECTKIFMTAVRGEFNCDTFFPDFGDFSEILTHPVANEGGLEYIFRVLKRP